ncbi:MAG: BTAD domain-containing putative transcriptional regulator [Kineosporiaceae bacterium]
MHASLQVLLLGPVEVRRDGEPVDVPGARLCALLARRALAPGQVLPPSLLVDAMWGELPPANAANALQSLVSRLRRVLPVGLLLSRPAGYVLDIAPDAVDAVRFDRQVASARAEEDDASRLAALVGAEALWRGQALGGLDDVPFVAGARAALEESRLAATEVRLDLQVRLGDAAAAVADAERLAVQYPLRESLTELRMRALAAAGRPADALGVFERSRALLADELGADPSPQLRALHAEILRGESPAVVPVAAVPVPQPPAVPSHAVPPPAVVLAPPPAPLAPTSARLRAPLTSFVGREDDVARVRGLLTEHRLVTLLGPGGAGKTRLALESARGIDGADAQVHWVELAPLTASAEEVAQLAGAVLDDLRLRGVTLIDGRGEARAADRADDLTRLADALQGEGLLVLDNCEHLIAAAAALADELLGRCPHLRVLATSREPLAITGEVLHPVTPLRLPSRNAPSEAELDAVAAAPAVRLFHDRAGAAVPGFALTPQTLPDVVEICRRLDGMPLAIELAAARLRTLPLPQLAGRLDQRFRLLTGGSRTAAPRHRTLRAVVEWSWDLLDARERDVAEHLAIFPAGATPEAVRAVLEGARPVADWSGAEADDVADTLLALADKSIVRVAEGDDIAGGDFAPTGAAPAGVRFRMLETLREYGVERLSEREALAPARDAHARHFRDLAEATDPRLRSAEQVVAIELLHAERENLVAALRHAVDAGDSDTAVRTAAGLSWFWMLQGSHTEAAQWLIAADSLPGPAPEAARAVVSIMRQIVDLNAGTQDEELSLEHLVTLLPEPGRYAHLYGQHPVFALVDPVVTMLRGDHAGTLRLLEEGAQGADPWVRAMMAMLAAGAAENAGETALELQSYLDGLERFRALGDRWGIAACLTGLGRVQSLDGDHAAAVRTYEEAVAILTEIHTRDERVEALLRLAGARARTGDLDGCREAMAEAARSSDPSGQPIVAAFTGMIRGHVAWSLGDVAEAEAQLRSALEVTATSRIRPPQLRAVVRAGLAALLAVERGRAAADEVDELVTTGMEEAALLWDMPCIAIVGVARAAHRWACGDARQAAVLLGAAEAVRGRDDRGDVALERVRAKVDADLGADAAAVAVTEGAALTRPEALVLFGLTPR